MVDNKKGKGLAASMNLRFLNENQIRMIDESLSSIGDFGEIHLVIEKGILRFIIKQESIDALKHESNKRQTSSR